MKKLLFLALLLCSAFAAFGQYGSKFGFFRPEYIGWPIDSNEVLELRWNPSIKRAVWMEGGSNGVNDSVFVQNDSICVIDLGDTTCVGRDSFYITDTTLCVITVGDTLCTPYTNTGINIYISDGSLTGPRTLDFNFNPLYFSQGGNDFFTFNANPTSTGSIFTTQGVLADVGQAMYTLRNIVNASTGDTYIRLMSGSAPLYNYCLGIDRSKAAFSLSSGADMGTTPILSHYFTPDSISIESEYLNFDSGTLFCNGANGRVGIGISVPTRPFHVFGLINASDVNGNLCINGGVSHVNSAENIVIGTDSGAGDALSGGDKNIIIGDALAGTAISTGSNNIVLGPLSGNDISTGSNNVIFGFAAGDGITTGDSNTVIGITAYDASANGDWDGNTAIGAGAGKDVGGDGSIYIGRNAGPATGTVNNKLYIDNTASSTPLIYGDMSSDYVTINGGHRYKLTETASTSYGSIAESESTLSFTATGAKTVTLPVLLLSTESQRIFIANNAASDNITVSAGSGDTITGDTTIEPGTGVMFISVSNGLWFTISTN